MYKIALLAAAAFFLFGISQSYSQVVPEPPDPRETPFELPVPSPGDEIEAELFLGRTTDEIWESLAMMPTRRTEVGELMLLKFMILYRIAGVLHLQYL